MTNNSDIIRTNYDKYKRDRLIFSFFSLLYIVGLYCFYLKYIPLIKSFQLILIPLFSIVFLLTAINIRKGILFFVFVFPLINCIPYFFRIYEHTPHAPVALPLFLFFFLGWIVHKSIFPSEKKLFPSLSIFRPMIMFSLVILISGIVTFFKFANFYPFLSDDIYELITNINGVTAGGAIMSTLFFSLNYLSGFFFFFILMNTVDTEPEKQEKYTKNIIIALLISTAISLAFACVQHFVDISIGNTPMRIQESLINSTFKDPLSFGAYLSIFIPVILGIGLAFRGFFRIFSFVLLVAALFFLPQTGLRSGLIAVPIALLLFLLFMLLRESPFRRLKSLSLKKALGPIALVLIILIFIFSILMYSKESIGFKRLQIFRARLEKGGISQSLGIRWSSHWKMAAYMMKDYPISGLGIGAYIIELPNYSKLYKNYYYKTDSAENYFIQVGAELGVIGIFFSLWIFWEIIKQIRRSVSRDLKSDRWKYIQLGIVCGIISFFIIFQFHTYIGSYEIKYTFWLLVGLLFMLGKKQDEKLYISKRLKIFFIVLLIFFSGVHLWNSAHSLSLKDRTEKVGFRQNFGFYQWEKTEDGREFRWTRGYGGIALQVNRPIMRIPLHASHPDIEKKPIKVEIFLVKDFFRQKNLLAEMTLTDNLWRTYEYSIPEEIGEEVILLIKVSRTWNPQRVRGIPDPRNLGVAVGRIEFKD